MSDKKNAVSLFYGDSGYEEVMNGINSPDGAVLFGVDDDTTDLVTNSHGNDWCRATFKGKKNTYIFDSTDGWVTKENKLPCYHKPVDGINIDDLSEEIMERIEAGRELPRLNEDDDPVVLASSRQYEGGPLIWDKYPGMPVPPITGGDEIGWVPMICPKPMGNGVFIAWDRMNVVVTIDGDPLTTLTTDTYIPEILEAFTAGKSIVAVYDNQLFQISSCTASAASFTNISFSEGQVVVKEIRISIVDGNGNTSVDLYTGNLTPSNSESK